MKLMSDPATMGALFGLYLSMGLIVLPERYFERFLTPTSIAVAVGGLSVLLLLSRYLGIFSETPEVIASSRQSAPSIDPALLREIRNYLAHAPSQGSNSATQVNIDDAFKGQLLAKLTTEAQAALSSFIESEIFRTTAESRFKDTERAAIIEDVHQMVSTYQVEMSSWRKNANVNLLIGLACAVIGIGIMWQTLVSLNFELESSGSWKITDLYRFLARFGLVILVESVAFFFLKLYREDRSMIRYLRNEITNLESKCLSLKTAISFGSPTDLAKVLQSLSATERNFLVKKGERVMSDIAYENTEVLFEKLAMRYPDLLGKITKTGS
ncbi:hypothetical protein [Bradyrhizobium centrosematis]|uniref:hypothetical protein n=1 Tax=Bradyrhizobium centrosematis TaxID=1300039 RepID=UPI0038906E8A